MSDCYYATCLTCNEESEDSIDARSFDSLLETAIEDGEALSHIAHCKRYSLEDHRDFIPSHWLFFIGQHHKHRVHFHAIWSYRERTVTLGEKDNQQ